MNPSSRTTTEGTAESSDAGEPVARTDATNQLAGALATLCLQDLSGQIDKPYITALSTLPVLEDSVWMQMHPEEQLHVPMLEDVLKRMTPGMFKAMHESDFHCLETMVVQNRRLVPGHVPIIHMNCAVFRRGAMLRLLPELEPEFFGWEKARKAQADAYHPRLLL